MSTEDFPNRTSFINKWVSGGIPGMIADVISPSDAKNTNNNEEDANAAARAKLVEELSVKLEQEADNEDATFTLTTSELRLLLGTPSPQPVDNNTSASPFSSWDLTSFFDEDLAPEETQAIMIALAAEEEEHKANGTAHPPPVLGSRQLTLQSLSSPDDEEIEYLVTLFGKELDALSNKRPSQMVSRQVSIQPPEDTATTDDATPATMRPSLDGRQASVRPVVNDNDTNNTQFVVTFPNNKGNGNNADSTTTKPSAVVRQLSIQPAPPIPDRTPTESRANTWTNDMPLQRNMSVSFNGGTTKTCPFRWFSRGQHHRIGNRIHDAKI